MSRKMIQFEDERFFARCVAGSLLYLAFFLLVCPPSPAQAVYGSIAGRVTDVSGAIVKGALVTATDLGTSESRISMTNSNGDYRIVDLVPGNYRIEVKMPGFKLFSWDPIEVKTDSAVRIDAALAVGGVRESVDVKEQTPLFDTQGSSVGQVIEGRQVQETPLNGRNVMNLVALVAGVVPQGGTQGSSAGNYAASGDITSEHLPCLGAVLRNALAT
jgi:hypothetical protein